MSFLLDTNICSAYVKGDRRVFGRFQQHWGRLFVSAITVGELTTWSLRANLSSHTLDGLQQLMLEIPCISVDHAIGVKYGELRAFQLRTGTPLPIADLLIAATALANDLTVVTHNGKDFSRVANLRVIDWLQQ